jgi:hypothetical protein
VIKGQTTEVIDISHFLPLAFPDWRNWKNPGVGLHDCVGKFDRRALLAALKRQTANRTSA